MIKIVFIPGNGGSSVNDNWFPSLKKDLEKYGLAVVSSEFPDADLARESYWIPFLKDELKVDENTILVGHSSGAIAAARFAEQYPILGSVLIGTYHTDLNMESERLSGYFTRPWDWKKISGNQKWTIIYASQDDPWIPIDQPRHIYKNLQCEYHEYTDQGHFGGDYFKPTFPELTTAILRKINKKDP